MATEHAAMKKALLRDRLSTRSWLAITVLVAAIQTVLVVLPAWSAAAALEGSHVLYLTARAFGRIASLQVSQKLLAYPQTPEEFPEVYEETALYVMPDRFRVDLVTENSRQVYLEVGDHSLALIDGAVVEKQVPFLQYQRLLRSRTLPQLMRTINQMGVETAVSSLGRVADTVGLNSAQFRVIGSCFTEQVSYKLNNSRVGRVHPVEITKFVILPVTSGIIYCLPIRVFG